MCEKLKKNGCTTFRGYDKNNQPKYSRKIYYNTFKEAEEWCLKNNLKKWEDKKNNHKLLNAYKCEGCGKYHAGRTDMKISLSYIVKNKNRYIPQFKVLGKIDLSKL